MDQLIKALIILAILLPGVTQAAPAPTMPVLKIESRPSLQERLKARVQEARPHSSLIFDFPVTNNEHVSRWLTYFQNNGKEWFKTFLSRSHRYLPTLTAELEKHKLPTDLAYVVMIESGFSAQAISSASAVGPWQFMAPTARQYGLRITPWLDERRDWPKSTTAAARYLINLRNEFDSWYLALASYNMGEGALRRRIREYKTNDYWELVRRNAIPEETRHYVPKILAGMLIAKAPALYGFRDVYPMTPLEYDIVRVPGGTKLQDLADHLQVTNAYLRELNPELLKGEIPRSISFHHIKVPKGAGNLTREYVKDRTRSIAMD